MIFEHMRDGLVLAQPRRVVERANKQWLRNGTIGFFLHCELDGIPFRFLQDKPRDVEQRIGATRHLDLARNGFHAIFVRQKRDGDFRRRCRRFTAFPFVPIIALRTTPAKSLLAVSEF